MSATEPEPGAQPGPPPSHQQQSPQVVQMYGAAWQMTPFSWRFNKGTDGHGNVSIFLTLETVVGRLMFPLTEEDVTRLMDSAREALTGLVTAR